jgi:hypothetical protein
MELVDIGGPKNAFLHSLALPVGEEADPRINRNPLLTQSGGWGLTKALTFWNSNPMEGQNARSS